MTAYRTKPIAVQAWVVSEITGPACESQEAHDALPQIVQDALSVGMLRTVKFWMVDGIGLNVFAGGPTEEPLQATPDMIVSVDSNGQWYAWDAATFHETHEAVAFVDPPIRDNGDGTFSVLTPGVQLQAMGDILGRLGDVGSVDVVVPMSDFTPLLKSEYDRLVSIGNPHVLQMQASDRRRDTKLDPLMLPSDEPKTEGE